MKSFLTRAISALIALAVLITLYVTLKIDGLKITVLFAVLVGSWETKNIIFKRETSHFTIALFLVLNLAIFLLSSLSLAISGIAYSLALVIFIICTLLVKNRTLALPEIQNLHAKSALGFFYIGLLPSFAYKILDQTSGTEWFVFLLASVFAGDTLAYVFGVLFGKHKVLPAVSPKKTWQGSIGGIIGSLIAAIVCWKFILSEQNLSHLIILAIAAGFVGQFGDFFESLLKRVAEIKDSGKIMPGHGGVLDRIDGVLFASPVILSGILIMSHLLS